MQSQRPSSRGIRGFTLLEVLIALVVLSVGLLGISAMMNFSLKSNDSAYMRTQAEVLAYNIMDHMRANNVGALNGDYNITFGQTVSSPPNCLGTANTCTPATLAQYDLNQWKQNLASANGGLPCGDGQVTLVSNNGVYEITVIIQWDDSRAQLGSALKTTSTAGSCATIISPLVFSTTTAL